MAKKQKPELVEVIPSQDQINMTFRQIVGLEVHRLKELASKTALSSEDHSNLKSLAGTYKSIETEARDQEQAESLHRLTHEELIQLAFKVINSLSEKEKKKFILELVKNNQRLLTP